MYVTEPSPETDSVYSRRKLSRRLGPAIGEWGVDGPWFDSVDDDPASPTYGERIPAWVAVAPKVYAVGVTKAK